MTPEVKSILLTEATSAEKRTFVTTFLNLDVAPDASDERIDALIAQAQPGIPTIFALTDPAEEAAFSAEASATAASSNDSVIGASVGSLGRNDPRYVINIPVTETDDKSGESDVFVGVNGRAWQIKRGVDVSVPARVFEALIHARGTQIRHEPDGHGDVDEVKSDFQRFGFNTVSMPSKAELDDWHERTDAQFCA